MAWDDDAYADEEEEEEQFTQLWEEGYAHIQVISDLIDRNDQLLEENNRLRQQANTCYARMIQLLEQQVAILDHLCEVKKGAV